MLQFAIQLPVIVAYLLLKPLPILLCMFQLHPWLRRCLVGVETLGDPALPPMLLLLLLVVVVVVMMVLQLVLFHHRIRPLHYILLTPVNNRKLDHINVTIDELTDLYSELTE